MLKMPNMTLYRLDRTIKKGGGVCIYVNNKWAKFIKLDHTHTTLSTDVEMLTLIMNKPLFRKLSITCLYRPPSENTSVCLDLLKKLFCTNLGLKFELWLLGDLNIDYLIRDQVDTKKYLSVFKTNGLKQIISDITRPYRNGGTCIDWIVTSSTFVQTSGVCNHMLSDHFPRERHTTVYTEFRDYSKYSLPNLRVLLLNTKWDLCNNALDPNVMYDFILSSLYKILEIMCPLRRYKQRLESARWMSPDIHRAI